MKLSLLRKLMLLDAAVLLLLGLVLICLPARVETAFGFTNLPPGVTYVLALWGSALATLGLGYAIAANEPTGHLLWVLMGISRGLLECLVGMVLLARGIVDWRQAGVGIILAGLLSVAYIALCPRRQAAAPPAAP
jgi:hypothetical protein